MHCDLIGLYEVSLFSKILFLLYMVREGSVKVGFRKFGSSFNGSVLYFPSRISII